MEGKTLIVLKATRGHLLFKHSKECFYITHFKCVKAEVIMIYGIYVFDSAEQKTKTINGCDYVLKGKHSLLKLHTPFLKSINHSYYYVLDEEIVIDCFGYIEQRCLMLVG